MFRLRSSLVLFGVILFCLSATHPVNGQIVGDFVIPQMRSEGKLILRYWDAFQASPEGGNYLYENPPSLFGGVDSAGNEASLVEDVYLMQTAAPDAFITSSGAIYDFSETTVFEVVYEEREDQDKISNVIFQCMTGGRRLELDEIRLVYLPGGSEEPEYLSPVYKALDDPHTGSFSERLISAFQWDLVGLDIRAFSIHFASPGSSMPLWEAQLDVVHGGEFVQELGYVLRERYLPLLRSGTTGLVYKDIPVGEETRFHLSGESLNLYAEPEFGFEHTGWVFNGEVIEEETVTIDFADSDESITALFAVQTYDDWREVTFFHANPLIEQGPDNTDESISGLEADPDGDGMTNLMEYAFGADPYFPDEDLVAANVGVVELDGEYYPSIKFRRQASEDESNDLLYQVQYSSDLQEWVNFDDQALVVVSDELSADSYRRIRYRSESPIRSHSSMFLRVQVQLKP